MACEVLSLYRAILRLGRHHIKLTDQSYFRRLVREEFERNRHQTDPAEVNFHIQVCQKDQVYYKVLSFYNLVFLLISCV